MEKLNEKVRLAVSVIGVGNAGGQVLNAVREDFPVFAINSSAKDLDSVVVGDKIPAFIAGSEARGAGKSRDIAKSLFKVNGRQLFEKREFTDMVEESDVVFVTGAMAGGTGSGIAPVLLNMLTQMYPKKIFIYYGILPKLTDSYQSQANSLQCYQEVAELNIPYMLADLDYYRDVPNDKAYTAIAEHIRTGMQTISGRFLAYTTAGMIDENDMRVIISEGGYMAVYALDKITQSDIDQKPIQDRIIDLVKNSPSAAIARDGAIRQMGMIVNCPEDMADSARTGNYNVITAHIGRPYSIFENFAVNSGSTGQFIMILSGMSDPDSRMLQAKAIVDEKPKTRKTTSAIGDASIYGTSANIEKLMTGTQPEEDSKKKSVLDSFFD